MKNAEGSSHSGSGPRPLLHSSFLSLHSVASPLPAPRPESRITNYELRSSRERSLRHTAYVSVTATMKRAIYEAMANSAAFRRQAKAFYEATGLRLKLLPAPPASSSNPFFRGNHSFCAAIQRTAKGRSACEETWRRLGTSVAAQRRCIETCCFANLVDVAVPVFVDNQHVATLLTGQVFTRRPRPAEFRAVVERLQSLGVKADLRRLRSLWKRTPVVPRAKLRGATRLLQGLARLLAEDARRAVLTANQNEPPAVRRAKEHVREHVHEPMYLADVAKRVGFSGRYFSEFFKRHTGIAFTLYVERVRVDNAKRLLLDRDRRITEAAHEAGFESLPHFNRVFKKLTGMSPTKYRRSVFGGR